MSSTSILAVVICLAFAAGSVVKDYLLGSKRPPPMNPRIVSSLESLQLKEELQELKKQIQQIVEKLPSVTSRSAHKEDHREVMLRLGQLGTGLEAVKNQAGQSADKTAAQFAKLQELAKLLEPIALGRNPLPPPPANPAPRNKDLIEIRSADLMAEAPDLLRQGVLFKEDWRELAALLQQYARREKTPAEFKVALLVRIASMDSKLAAWPISNNDQFWKIAEDVLKARRHLRELLTGIDLLLIPKSI